MLIGRVAHMRAIDDAQWLDRSSAEAIAFAARRLLADPVAVLVAVREGDGSPLLAAGLPDLVVAGLDAAEASDLLKTVAERQLPPDVVERLVDATGGNPLAMLELARADPHVSPHHPLPVPTTVDRAYLPPAAGPSPRAPQRLLLM